MPNDLTLYHNPRCSKSRAALQLLQQSGTELTIVDYQESPPDAATLRKILSLLEMDASELIRRGDSLYKRLQADIDKHTDNRNEEALIELLVQHPALLERPIVFNKEVAVIGRPTDKIIDLLDSLSDD